MCQFINRPSLCSWCSLWNEMDWRRRYLSLCIKKTIILAIIFPRESSHSNVCHIIRLHWESVTQWDLVNGLSVHEVTCSWVFSLVTSHVRHEVSRILSLDSFPASQETVHSPHCTQVGLFRNFSSFTQGFGQRFLQTEIISSVCVLYVIQWRYTLKVAVVVFESELGCSEKVLENLKIISWSVFLLSLRS